MGKITNVITKTRDSFFNEGLMSSPPSGDESRGVMARFFSRSPKKGPETPSSDTRYLLYEEAASPEVKEEERRMRALSQTSELKAMEQVRLISVHDILLPGVG